MPVAIRQADCLVSKKPSLREGSFSEVVIFFAAIEINEAAGFDDFLFFLVKGQDIKGNGFAMPSFRT